MWDKDFASDELAGIGGLALTKAFNNPNVKVNGKKKTYLRGCGFGVAGKKGRQVDTSCGVSEQYVCTAERRNG